MEALYIQVLFLDIMRLFHNKHLKIRDSLVEYVLKALWPGFLLLRKPALITPDAPIIVLNYYCDLMLKMKFKLTDAIFL